MLNRKWVRKRLLSGETIWASGAYDALSAKMIERAKFDAVFTTGFGISAAFLGEPDVGLYTMSENLNIVRQIVNAVKIPVIADCDTGYGNTVNVARTVREFETAGVAGLVLEDQVFPKICPTIGGKLEVLPLEEAVAKIEAAIAARQDPDMVIIARTDAPTEAEALVRARAYAEVGADLVQPNSRARDLAMLRNLKRNAGGKPISLQILGWMEAELSVEEIQSVAGLAVYPLLPIATVISALSLNLERLAMTKLARDLPISHVQPREFAMLLGFQPTEEFRRNM